MVSRIERSLPLPPLTALRAFEATARHASFTLAAKELCVTQTAISHQVKLLEAHLGLELFRRLPRRIEPTHEGRAWAEAMSDVFGRLHAANRRLRVAPARVRPVVTVSVLPSFASRWLVPRLGRFFDRHPNVDVRISPSAELSDFSTDAVDLGVRYGYGRYPGLRVEKLFEDSWVVVASPDFPHRKKIRTVRDLGRVTLIEDDQYDAFQPWLAAHGVKRSPDAHTMVFTDSSMLVEAAVRGQGVALARTLLASDELRAGRLVRVFPRLTPMKTGLAYYLAGVRGPGIRPEVTAFREWIRAEIATVDAFAGGTTGDLGSP
jgi:LysR family glycine cleavage system transcriptional activator